MTSRPISSQWTITIHLPGNITSVLCWCGKCIMIKRTGWPEHAILLSGWFPTWIMGIRRIRKLPARHRKRLMPDWWDVWTTIFLTAIWWNSTSAMTELINSARAIVGDSSRVSLWDGVFQRKPFSKSCYPIWITWKSVLRMPKWVMKGISMLSNIWMDIRLTEAISWVATESLPAWLR